MIRDEIVETRVEALSVEMPDLLEIWLSDRTKLS